MRAGRLILVVATLVAILIVPPPLRDALLATDLSSAYATSSAGLDPAGGVYRDDNDNNGNDNGDDNGNESESGDNDNVTCYASMNSNEEVPCDFLDNDHRVGARAPVHRAESRTAETKCFDTREVGVIQLGTGSYDVTVSVLPHSSFGQTTRMTLRSLDPATVPAVPGALVDRVVFALDAQSDCSGVAIGTLPNLVNLGIVYNVVPPVDKARLQIARLEGGSWVNVDTVPDPVPGNPYVSTTIDRAGTYALFQR